MNSVISLQSKPFSLLSLEEKLEIRNLGRPTPNLDIKQSVQCKNRTFTRIFRSEMYDKYDWLCGSEVTNALYCFPCILFSGEGLWTHSGVKDLNHLVEKIKKHQSSKQHIQNVFSLAFMSTTNIAQELDSEYRRRVALHNDQVKQNRYVLNIIINCIRFCGAFELALRGHDKSQTSSNPGVIRGLIDFSAELYSSLKLHLERATIFKGTSKAIQNEILQTIMDVSQEEIVKEIEEADFLSVIIDETSDMSNKFQMAVVLRYIVNSKPVERFWRFIAPEKHDANTLASLVLSELERLKIHVKKEKLIAQTYDGAAVMAGRSGGVQAIVKETYPSAHYVHYHAHQLNLVILNATSINRSVRVFFADLQGICTFFSLSPQRTAVLDKVVKRRLPRSIPIRWNFHSRSVNTLFDYREEITECFRLILEGDEITNIQTISLASGHIKTLNSKDFTFWLFFFHKIMPHVEVFFGQFQRRDLDPCLARKYVTCFEEQVLKVRNENFMTQHQDTLESKRRKLDFPEMNREAKEICDVIITQIKERFKFTGHLTASMLYQHGNFREFDSRFPEEILKATCETYKFLDCRKLHTELSTIYATSEFRTMAGAVSLLEFIMRNNLQETLSETVKLLKVLITIPMSSTEAERCFSTLKRIKTFLRNTMGEERLSALAMLSMEKSFMMDIPNFNERVMQKFAQNKNRRMDFLYK